MLAVLTGCGLQVKAACMRLKEVGYTIALDDFVADGPHESLTNLADIIKVDLQREVAKAYWQAMKLAREVSAGQMP